DSSAMFSGDSMGLRMRCELAPPNLLGLNAAGLPDSTNWTFRDERRMDQLMLTASNFVPHCTEFMVEWSFGLPAQTTGSTLTGELQWYGGPVAQGDVRPRPYRYNRNEHIKVRTLTRADGSTRQVV